MFAGAVVDNCRACAAARPAACTACIAWVDRANAL
jgi:hypothetical protein